MTLLATETDFTEAGELSLFMGESQVAYLEDTMWEQGYLDTRQMSGAFQLLRSNDLIWSRMVHQYLEGRPGADESTLWRGTPMRPACPIACIPSICGGCSWTTSSPRASSRSKTGRSRCRTSGSPIFAVATVTDHVAPWRSVFKIHLLTDATIDFVLTSGGHNAGIVSEPGHPGRVYQSARRPGDGRYIDPDTWRAAAPSIEGSWWPTWIKWLGDNSSPPIDPPGMGAPERGLPPLADAPGRYVCAP